LPPTAVWWTTAHQITPLAATFRMAGLAASDPDTFRAAAAGLSDDFDSNVDAAMAEFISDPPTRLMSRWQAVRAAAVSALAAVPAGQVVPWLVRPLPAPVLAAAGMMELCGHGQDIADALGVRRQRTDRVGHLGAFVA